MNSQALAKKKLPDAPGVYFFLRRRLTRMATRINADRKHKLAKSDVLYIGRATSLRNRVRSYFAPDIAEKRSQWIAKMLTEAKSIDFRKTDSVLEAVLLEADLIKKLKPPYNTELKDDKSFNCVVITDAAYPAVFIVRSKDIDFSSLTVNSQRLKVRRQKLLAAYGPFPHGFHLQTALKIIRRIFPLRDAKCTPCSEQTRQYQKHTDKLEFVSMCRPCFSRQVGLCPGTCTGEMTKGAYAKTIRNLRLFFEGKTQYLLKLLQREMKAAAKRQEFERAGELKRQLFALRHIQDVALLQREDLKIFPREDASTPFSKGRIRVATLRIEAFDISHFGGKDIVGAMAVVENGVARPSEYRLFKLRSITCPHETAGLSEILRRRFTHPEWLFPHLIVVDGNEAQKKAAEDVLSELGQQIPVVAVVKDERHRPRGIIGVEVRLKRLRLSRTSTDILLANSEAHRFVLRFQRKRRPL